MQDTVKSGPYLISESHNKVSLLKDTKLEPKSEDLRK